ncbi:MAG: NAD-binding protein [Chloroflexi bacterium]|nr:NAD-binding protein [Chloroflexota bacterium]
MGRPMSKRLLDAVYPLIVYNRSRSAMEEIAGHGAQLGASPKDVASRCDVIITMLPDSPDVEAVGLGPDGLLAGARPGCTWVDMSTIAPSTAKKVAQAGQAQGVRVLDAPVSGGEVGAQQGTLSIMVGGDEETLQEVLPILRVLGGKVTRCGDAGAGQTVKACNQVLVGVTIAGVAEALTLGAQAGVEPAKIVEVLGAGLARCGVLETRGERIVQGDFRPGFRGRLHYKDLRIAVATGQEYGVPLLVTPLVHELFKRLVVSGQGDLDHTGLVRVLQELAGTPAKDGS